MRRLYPTTFSLAAVLLLSAVGASLTFAADAAPTGVLQAPVFTPPGQAPAISNVLNSDDYRQMQESAPEAVVLRITSVKTEVGKPKDNSVGSSPLLVTAQAAVIRVTRTATDLKNGSVIYLLYGHAQPAPGQPGIAPIPVVKYNTEYTAFLTGSSDKEPYRPAAGAQSFIDNSAPANAGPTAAKSTGTFADPALLPSPDNPTPTGSPRLTRTNLAQFAKAIQTDGHWGASIANADPLPIQSNGQGMPTLLAYYAASIRAPATQPKILVYQTGDAVASARQTTTTERALIIDSNGHLLGDVLWANRSVDGKNPPPLPIWHWFPYKLEVEDPVTHEVQTILLN